MYSANNASGIEARLLPRALMSRSYTHVPGFFLQDDPGADPAHIGALPPRFGLLDASETRWATFAGAIARLNAEAAPGVSYKVFFLGRHGQGYHNVAEAKYGTAAWDDHHSKLNGDAELVWGPDPLLTALGHAQAADARAAWRVEAQHGIPVPETHFLSPLRRALDTWKDTFLDAADGSAPGPRGLILEDCREEYGVHTCDLRSPRSALAAAYPPPTFAFAAGFAEDDPLWAPDARETRAHIVDRATGVLARAFAGDATYISITAHGGFINGFLSAIGRPFYALPTGGVLPVVVKGAVVPGSMQ